MNSQHHTLAKVHTRKWVEEIVIGLNLCPFAVGVWKQTRIEVSASHDLGSLLMDFGRQLEALLSHSSDDLPTTLLVVPNWLEDFAEYLDVLAALEQCLDDLNLSEEFQVASFHPRYQFAGQDNDDPAHSTNRSPWPIFHILREASVAEAVATHPDAEGIPERNAAHFRALGVKTINRLLADIQGTGTSQ